MSQFATGVLAVTLGVGIFWTPSRLLAQEPTSIEIEPSSLNLEIGKKAQLKAVVKDADGNVLPDAQVLFFSGSRLKLGVTPSGSIEPYLPGEHKVTALSPETSFEGEPDTYTSSREPGIRATITVTVPEPPLASIEIVDVPSTVYTGTTVQVRVAGVDASGAKRNEVASTLNVNDETVAVTDGFGNLSGLAPGTATLIATAAEVTASHPFTVQSNPLSSIELMVSQREARTGDVIHFQAIAKDARSRIVDSVPISFSLRSRPDAGHPESVGAGAAAQISDDGRFVAEQPGIFTVLAMSGGVVAQESVRITQRDVTRKFEFLGQARIRDHRTSDLWVWEGLDGRDYAVVGSWSGKGHAFFYDVTDPTNMVLVDTVQVDARTVNDVKVSENRRICIISREGASNRRNGIVVLDVSNPREVKILSTYDDQITGGVHNIFVDDDYVYAVNNGRRWDVINIENPTKPVRVSRFETNNPGRAVHDVWVADGIAYHAGWTEGVILVDVGGGGKGGSPANPIEMGRAEQLTGWTHAVAPFQSKSAGKSYVFVGDESSWDNPRIPKTPMYVESKLPGRMRGWLHVVEFDDPSNPQEVAQYKIGDYGVHNYWVDWDEEILYVGYYQGGLRVLDVSGELMGDLYAQGREIGRFYSDDPEGFIPNSPMVWGPQPHKGSIFFSDLHSGLWAVRLLAPEDEEKEKESMNP